MSDSLGLAAGAVTLALGVLTLLGLVVRYVLLPYLREQLKLTRETHAQITTDPSTPAAEPTLREEVGKLGGEIEDATLELRSMALMFDGHLDWAQREVDRLRRERQEMVDAIWRELRRQTASGLRSGTLQREEATMSTHEEENETAEPVPAGDMNEAPSTEETDR